MSRRTIEQLLRDQDWDTMDLYDLERLRGYADIYNDHPGYWKAIQKLWKNEQRNQEMSERKESYIEFDVLEYVKQAKPGTVELTEQFFQAFYTRSVDEQGEVIDILGRFHRSVSSARSLLGEGDFSREGYLTTKRIDSFVEQWVKGQTDEWVTLMMVRAQDTSAITSKRK